MTKGNENDSHGGDAQNENDNHSPPKNSTVKERLIWYVQHGQKADAERLIKVCTDFEDWYEWDIEFPTKP